MTEGKKSGLKEVLEMRKTVVSNEEYDKIKDKYKMEMPDDKLTDRQHQIIVGRAAKLAMMVIDGGGTDDEVKLAILNTMVCIDAKKYMLDWARWKKDNDICLLIRKYLTMNKNKEK